MKRIMLSLEEEVYDLLEKRADESGASVSALAKELLTAELVKATDIKGLTVSDIHAMIIHGLENRPAGEEFFICNLFPPSIWASMSRSEKMVASKALSREIRKDERFAISSVRNKVNYYIRKES